MEHTMEHAMYPDTYDIGYVPTEQDLRDWAEHLAALELLERNDRNGEQKP